MKVHFLLKDWEYKSAHFSSQKSAIFGEKNEREKRVKIEVKKGYF